MLGKAVVLTLRSNISLSEMPRRWRRQQRDGLAYDPFLPAQRGGGGRGGSQFLF
jgi:hypothetical protein